MKNTTKGAVIAGMVAGFFAVGCANNPDTGKTDQNATYYKCTGEKVVEKGKSDCGGHGNENGCAGTNECKGKGWKKMTKADCEKAGGTAAEEIKE